MLVQRSRQLHRQMTRAARKAAKRAPQAKATWGDSRLNRRKRFAHLALREHIAALAGPVSEGALAALALRFGLPPHFVHELTTAAGLTLRLKAAA